MDALDSTAKLSHPRPSHPVWGTLLGLASAVGYTLANIFLRAAADCDPIWVSCVKAMPTVACVAPWLACLAWRGRRIFPAPGVVAVLVASGLFGHLAGNVAFQWSLGIVGMALTVPLCLGTIICSSAVLGRVYLREPVTLAAALSLTMLVAAIWTLSAGADDAYRAMAVERPAGWLIAAGVAAACISGLAYAVLGLAIRYAVSGRATVSSTIFTVSLVGLISLTAWSWARLGWEGMRGTTYDEWVVMLLAGIFNLAAFLSLTKALQLTTLIYVNALNASQVAMAALAGVLLFGETASPALRTGVALTILGLLLMPRQASPVEPE